VRAMQQRSARRTRARELKLTTVGFRCDSDLAKELAGLANASEFMRAAVKRALGGGCPLCRGAGRVDDPSVEAKLVSLHPPQSCIRCGRCELRPCARTPTWVGSARQRALERWGQYVCHPCAEDMHFCSVCARLQLTPARTAERDEGCDRCAILTHPRRKRPR
jgi:hypothetical protein